MTRYLKEVKAFHQGSSTCIVIPVAVCEIYGVKAGDRLMMTMDSSHDYLILRKMKK